MIILDFIGAILTVSFWIVVVYVACRIARRCIRTTHELRAGQEVLRHRR